jgi:hypothetical protein
MLTMATYVRWVRQPDARRYTLMAIVFAMGLMAKPILVTLPFVLLLMDWWPLGRIRTTSTPSARERCGRSSAKNCRSSRSPPPPASPPSSHSEWAVRWSASK